MLSFADKINLKRSDKCVTLSNISIYYTWKNIKISYKNNNLKIPVPTSKDKFKLSEGSYFPWNTEDYIEYIIKYHETVTDNPPIVIYVNKIEIELRLKLKQGIISNF